jgi:hypothetical protein
MPAQQYYRLLMFDLAARHSQARKAHPERPFGHAYRDQSSIES